MLLAYIDEIGEPGAFVSKADGRYKTSPAFGYAGFVLSDYQARSFGAKFVGDKRALFSRALEDVEHVATWEKKGAELFRPRTPERAPHELRVFNALVKHLRRLRGELFYYAEEKPLGTPKQTKLDADERRMTAMRETVNRLARHAKHKQEYLLIVMDAVQEHDRKDYVQKMYAHILGRALNYEEMRRLPEPPMHMDSELSANIQFADWISAFVTRAIEYQLLQESPYGWVTDRQLFKNVSGSFTHESKLRLWKRGLEDLHHSQILRSERPVWPEATGQLVGSHIDPDRARKMRGVAEASTRETGEM